MKAVDRWFEFTDTTPKVAKALTKAGREYFHIGRSKKKEAILITCINKIYDKGEDQAHEK